MKKKYETESVTITDVEMMHGGTCKRVEMIISEGKLMTLKHALKNYPTTGYATPVAADLLAMIK